MITICLFYCYRKVFILIINIWMTEKNTMKHHYLKKYFYSHLNMEAITDTDYAHAKKVY